MKIYSLKIISEPQRLSASTRRRLSPYVPGEENRIAVAIDSVMKGKSSLEILNYSYHYNVGILTENLPYDIKALFLRFKMNGDPYFTGQEFIERSLEAVIVNNNNRYWSNEPEASFRTLDYSNSWTASVDLSSSGAFRMNASRRVSTVLASAIFWAAAEQELTRLVEKRVIPQFYGEYRNLIERHTLLRWLPFIKYLAEPFATSFISDDAFLYGQLEKEIQLGQKSLASANFSLGLEKDNALLFPFKPDARFVFLRLFGLAGKQ